MADGNLFENVPDDLPEELFETLAGSEDVTIERIVSRGHTSPATGWYDQDKHEWVVVLQGSAVLGFEGEPSVTLEAGDHLSIPAHKKHRVEYSSESPETIWLAVHYR